MDHDDLVGELGALLGPEHRLSPELPEGSVTVRLPRGVLARPLVAIPDCHLADGSEGDEFFDDDPANVARLEAVLGALGALVRRQPDVCALQLGDWFDLWRANASAIEDAPLYRRVHELDAAIGLPHLIGNHDASFVNVPPRGRAASAFRLGDFLMPEVYALHGHQAHVASTNDEGFDQAVVAAATTLARFVPGVRTLEAFIDSDLDAEDALKAVLKRTLGVAHGDPPPRARPVDPRGGSPDPETTFAAREDSDALAAIVANVASASRCAMPKLAVVGHSHNPCVAWSDAGDAPLVIVDAGACVFGRFNLLVGAGDRVTVFDLA